jgi:DNA-binding FadR family transcriptional regulator
MTLRRNIAYDAIRLKILSGKYPPGAALSEAEIAQTLGISRTPVREALMGLQQEGFVTVLPSRGAMVRILGRSRRRPWAASVTDRRRGGDVGRLEVPEQVNAMMDRFLALAVLEPVGRSR